MSKNFQIFTPHNTVNLMLNKMGFEDLNCLGKYIVDHSCGDGNFLEEIVKRIISNSSVDNLEHNLSFVYGFELDSKLIPIVMDRLDFLIKDYDISVKWNIFNINSLKLPNKYNNFFDFVVGNPPYIRSPDLDDDERTYLKENYEFCKKGNIDIYYAFFELSFNIIKSNGKISMITPNSFLYNVSANTLRDYIVDKNNLVEIINYGTTKIFENADTYTAITYFDLNKTDSKFKYTLYEKDKPTTLQVNLEDFKNQKMWLLKNSIGDKLGNHVNISVGIATLCDKVYLMEKVKEIDDDIWLMKNKIVGEVEIEKHILQPILKISKVVSSYIIFPYSLQSDKYKIIKEDKFKLNYPKAYNHLLANKEEYLDKRDKGKVNKVAWYAYGRGQGMSIIGDKIIFSGMNDKPNFIIHNEPTLLHSGYYITLKKDSPYTYDELYSLLNSEKMREFVAYSSGDFSGGFKSYKKSIIENFKI